MSSGRHLVANRNWWNYDFANTICYAYKTHRHLPLPGIQPVLMDERRNEIEGNQVVGSLCIKFPWPGIARTIWGDHQRYKETYFSAFPGKYFTGDGALRDEVGYYRITGRVDICNCFWTQSGYRTIEDAINEHPAVAESAMWAFRMILKEMLCMALLSLRNGRI
jgi:acetyl-CoA synthetase